jgi:hypothetical protein
MGKWYYGVFVGAESFWVFWQMIYRVGRSKGFWRLRVFVGVFGVFGLKYGKNASKLVENCNSCT